MRPISFRLTTIQPRFEFPAPTTTPARERAPGRAREPTRTDVRVAVQKLGDSAREVFGGVSRSDTLPRSETEVFMARGISSGKVQSFSLITNGSGTSTGGKNKPTGIAGAVDAGAATNPGSSNLDTKLNNNASLAAVRLGTLTINGQSVEVNPARDTVAGVVASLNALNGVSASVDPSSGLVTLVTERRGATLEIADETGLLSALGIGMGAVKAAVAERRSGPDPTAVAAAVAVDETVSRVNDVLDTLAQARDVPAGFRAEVMNAIREAVAAVPGASGAGLTFQSVDGEGQLLVDPGALSEVLARDPHALDALLSGPRGIPEAISALLARHAEPEAPSAPTSLPPPATVIDGRRLLRTKSVIRDRALEVLVMQRFRTAPATGSRFDVRA